MTTPTQPTFVREIDTNAAAVAGIERQLGEVVGTVRMTVTAVDSLRQSIERLAEKVAFRGDLDQARIEFARAHAELELKVDANRAAAAVDSAASASKAEAALTGIRTSVEKIRTTHLLAMGGVAVLVFVAKFIDFGIKITVGGG